MPRTNWAGNVVFGARRFHRPSTVDELCEIVAGADRVRAAGTGHSFSSIADTDGDLIFTDGLPPVFEVSDGKVTVSGGMRLGEVAQRLHAAGLALPNLPSLPHISVAGAISTGTHGSGTGNLATFVDSVQMVLADGRLMDLGAQAAIAVGMLGVVTTVTLDVVPAFELRQYVYDDLPWERVAEALASAYSVSLFTDWRRITQVWRKGFGDWDGARPAGEPRHPVVGLPPEHCTQQLGVPGPCHERLPHFRLSHTPSSGDELQSEWFVELRQLDEVAGALRRLDFGKALQVSELRTVKADDLWLSPAFRRDCLAIHFTWVRDLAAVSPVIAAVEEALEPFGPRAHWGKLSVAGGHFPGALNFLALARQADPAGKFRLSR